MNSIRDVLYTHAQCVELYEKYSIVGVLHQIGNVGPGWLPIVEDLIVKLIDNGWNKELWQVKEKFGALRFYGNVDTQLQPLVWEAERKASQTCEVCGKEGCIRNWDGWWHKCLCEKHGKEWGAIDS